MLSRMIPSSKQAHGDKRYEVWNEHQWVFHNCGYADDSQQVQYCGYQQLQAVTVGSESSALMIPRSAHASEMEMDTDSIIAAARSFAQAVAVKAARDIGLVRDVVGQ